MPCPPANESLSANEPLQPLTVLPETPVFEQFNFQPLAISASVDAVVVETPHYTFTNAFSQCQEGDPQQNSGQNNQSDRTWSITNTPPKPQEPFDYEASLKSWANPEYEAVEFNGQSYQYRIRLQADWLDAEIRRESEDSEAIAPTSESNKGTLNPEGLHGSIDAPEPEEAVYFDLKTPDGQVTTHQLYSLADVQAAGLGASLGIPRIADTVVTPDAIWFAATTSQGEGDNGFASLLHYSPQSEKLTIQQPSEIQGDQITSMVATNSATDSATDRATNSATDSTASGQSHNQPNNQSPNQSPNLTLWLGTLQSGEGNPSFPASGLVAYQPQTEALSSYTISNSPIVGAIPYELAAVDDSLWVATGNGVCQVEWQAIDQTESWDCWQFTATANLPDQGIPLYDSLLAEEPVTTLKGSQVEVLWAALHNTRQAHQVNQPQSEDRDFRYEVVYEPGFETTLAQGGYRMENEVARKMSGGEAIFWPGRQWHWNGKRFTRALDEVSWNLVGGGPQGLVSANSQSGFSFNQYAIRGDFNLLSLEPEATQLRYYSGWVNGDALTVYPQVRAVEPVKNTQPNPLTAIAQKLPGLGP